MFWNLFYKKILNLELKDLVFLSFVSYMIGNNDFICKFRCFYLLKDIVEVKLGIIY